MNRQDAEDAKKDKTFLGFSSRLGVLAVDLFLDLR